MRFSRIATALLLMLASGDAPAAGLYMRSFGPEPAAAVRTLVFVLHGDAPFTRPSYHYAFAAAAARTPGVRAIGLLRPGYEDADGDRSPGERGLTTGDNYDPDRIEAIARAIDAVETGYPRARRIIVGHSGGAAIAADLTALHPGLANGVLLVSCPCDLPRWRAFMQGKMPLAAFDRPVASLDPLHLAPRLSRRLALSMVVGAADDTAPPALSKAYAAAARRSGVATDLQILPGKSHEILGEPDVLAALQALIQRTSSPR